MQECDMEQLFLEKHGSIGILAIHRPESLNALNHKVLVEIFDFVHHRALKEDLRALILTGAGEKAFIAGADIKAMQKMLPREMDQFCELGQKVTLALERAPFVTIAAVNGFAFGGGLEMALSCDFIYASTTAKMGLPEVSLGLIPGFGGTQRLSRAIGTRRAKELIMTGKTITAGEALEIGLVNKLCDPNQLITDCRTAAEKILSNSFSAVCQAKRAINGGESLEMATALELERTICSLCFSDPDRSEGMAAFIEKRKPQFA